MSDSQPFPTPEQRHAMEKRCRWLMKTRKILEIRLAFYVRSYDKVDSEDPLGRREAMGELLNDDPTLRIPTLSGLVSRGPVTLWNQFDIALVMDRNQSNISRTLRDVKNGGKYPEAWKRRMAKCTHEEDGKTAGYDERVFDLLLGCQEEDYLLRFFKPRRGTEPRSREEEEQIRRFWEEEKRRAEADAGLLGLTERDVWALRLDHEDEGTDGGVLSLKDAVAELLRGMTRWKGAWAIATLLSIYTELSTFFHNLYAWFPLISLAVAALCILFLRRGTPGRILWRSVGATSLLILAIWCVCFVGRGFSVENPSLLTRLPLMEKLQEGIARMEGIEAQRTAETRTLLEEALSVTNSFLTERRRNDTPVSETEYQQMLRRTEVREVPESLRGLRCALRVNEARICLEWSIDDYRSGLTKLQTAERLLQQSRAELDELERTGPKIGEDLSPLRGKLASAEAAALSLGMDRGMWQERVDEAIRTAEEAVSLLRGRSPSEAIEALETCSNLFYHRAILSMEPLGPSRKDMRRAEEAAREGLALSERNGDFMYPSLSLALGLAMPVESMDRAAEAYEDGIRHTDMQLQPNMYVVLSAALAEACAVLQMETQDPVPGKDAKEALSAAFGIINRYAHMTSNAFLQFAVARASLAVGLAAKSRKELDMALDALDRVLEIWTFTPYTSNHIQASYTRALTLSGLAFFPQKHEDFDRLEREGAAMNSPLGDLIKNAARDAHRQRDLLDQAARLRTLRKAVEVLERIAYYDRTNPTLSQKCAMDLFTAYRVLAKVHTMTGAMSTLLGEPGAEGHYSGAERAIGRARELAGGRGAEKIAQDEKFLRDTKMTSGTAKMLMSLTGKTSQDVEEFFLKDVGR